ncbi:MAG: sigma-70 family RNA polymerase sigma factor, partial [Acidimicrobiia bacterium]|nr:sigma-70 family RNA polymerase sigma factor [Acidimicrobiia bacterium]
MVTDHAERRARDADLATRAAAGDQAAFDELFELWFAPVWNVAWGVLSDEDLAADVAQEAFLAAWRNLATLRDPGSFGGWVLRIGRNRALNRLRAERRAAPCERETVAAIADRADQRAGGGADEPAHRAERRERQALVWAAAAVLGERDWLLLDLHLRHGLTPAELAGELGVTANNCHQILHRLRRRLGAVMGHYLLWQRRAGACPALAPIAAQHRRFDHETDQAIARHQATCTTCAATVANLVRPEQLLATLPALVPPPAHLGTRVSDGLRTASQPARAEPSPVSVYDRPAGETSTAGTPPACRSGNDRSPRFRRRRQLAAATAVTAMTMAIAGAAPGIAHRAHPPEAALTAVAREPGSPTTAAAAPPPDVAPAAAVTDPAPTPAATGAGPTGPYADPGATSPSAVGPSVPDTTATAPSDSTA